MSLLRELFVVLLLAATAAGQGSVAERVRRTLDREDCQTTLPDELWPPPGAGDRSPTPGGSSRRRPAAPPQLDFVPLRVPTWFGTTLLWLGVAVVGVVLVAAIARAVRDRTPRTAPARPAGTPRRLDPPPTEPTAELADFDRMAAAGDYTAAVHALLQRAIAAWQARGEVVPKHATAREVLRRARTATPAASALAVVVQAAEATFFGGRAADRSAFEATRAQYVAWEAACRRR